MDEGAIVTNVATILAKDMLLDRSPKFRPMPYPMQQFQKFLKEDDESLDYYVCKMLQKQRVNSNNYKRFKHSTQDSQFTDDSSSLPSAVIMPVPTRRLAENLEVNLRISQFLSPRDFEMNFHMRKGTFNALLEILGPLMKEPMRKIDGSLISRETFLSLALWKLTTGQHFEEISCRFNIPVSICSRSTTNFCDLISNFINTFISWPNRQQMINAKNCKSTQMIGAIGTKRFEVFLEDQDEDVFIVLQIVCNNDLIITDCYVELATKYEPRNSHIVNKLTSEPLPDGCYLLGNNTFPLQSFLITPYSDTNHQKRLQFNKLINEQLKMVHNTMKQMMHRFQTLFSLEAADLSETKKIIETICGLHNFCRRLNDNCIPKLPESQLQDKCHQIKGRERDFNGIIRREELLKQLCSSPSSN